MLDSTDNVTDLRLRLRAAGYDPIPAEGKRPPMEGWQQKIGAGVEEIALWSKSWHLAHNTGILCRRVPTIDIDLMSEEAAEAIEALAREHFEEVGHFMVRTGKAPKRAIPLRCDEPFKKLTANFTAPNGAKEKIEILADGQQFIAFGLHPETSKSYAWHGGSPRSVAREELPYAREGDLLHFLEQATAILVNEHGYRAAEERPKGNGQTGQGGQGAADWAWLTEAILRGHELHDSLRDLAGKLVTAGMNPGAAVNFLRGLLQRSSAARDGRWQDRFDDIERLVDSAGAGRQQQQAPVALPFIDMQPWDSVPAPARPWAVIDRIPINQPTLFSGEGAAGKTLVELQLCCAHVLARDWLGGMPQPGPAIYYGAEDDGDELHRRLALIAEHYGATFADLIAGGLHLLSFAGEDALLAVADRQGKIVPTPLYARLLEAAGDIKPRHIGIDATADTFAGNEIDRSQVRQFVGLTRKLAIVAYGSVVLLAHPSLTGISSGSGLSGSTAWHNSVRARMLLRTPKDSEGDGQSASDLRELAFLKNNYGPLAESVVLRVRNGLFLPEAGQSALEKLAREQRIDETFLDVLRKLIKQNRPVSPSAHAPSNYAPKVIAGHPDGKAYTQRDYQAALERLLTANRIHIESFGPPSKQVRHLALGAAASEGCGDGPS
jgi:RecA-family ATPase